VAFPSAGQHCSKPLLNITHDVVHARGSEHVGPELCDVVGHGLGAHFCRGLRNRRRRKRRRIIIIIIIRRRRRRGLNGAKKMTANVILGRVSCGLSTVRTPIFVPLRNRWPFAPEGGPWAGRDRRDQGGPAPPTAKEKSKTMEQTEGLNKRAHEGRFEGSNSRHQEKPGNRFTAEHAEDSKRRSDVHEEAQQRSEQRQWAEPCLGTLTMCMALSSLQLATRRWTSCLSQKAPCSTSTCQPKTRKSNRFGHGSPINR